MAGNRQKWRYHQVIPLCCPTSNYALKPSNMLLNLGLKHLPSVSIISCLSIFPTVQTRGQMVHYGYVSAVSQSSAVAQWKVSGVDPKAVYAIVKGKIDRKRYPMALKTFTKLGGDTFLIRLAGGGMLPDEEYELRMGGALKAGLKFRTLPPAESNHKVRLAIGSCMHYERFYMANLFPADFKKKKPAPLLAKDSLLGYPVLDQIVKAKPLVFIANGDNVYYDHPRQVTNVQEMRQKWDQQFRLPRMQELCSKIPIWWSKDDHDFRGDDADTTSARYPFPTNAIAKGIFREQAPLAASDRLNDTLAWDGTMHKTPSPPYRKIRLNNGAEVFMLEGRDFRSPNYLPDDAMKSIWGLKQQAWLMDNLKKSTAKFKIIITPTPLIGPDDKSKKDNHTSIGGFRTEGNKFFEQLKAMGLDTNEVILITGDRHWQYHSIHPTGYQEFSTGSMVTRNSRIGRKPGDAASTDPDGLIRQPYIQPEPTGGFALLDVEHRKGKWRLNLKMIGERGKLLYKWQATR